MADLLLRGVDEFTAERLRLIARERNATVADVVLELLKNAVASCAGVVTETVSYRTVTELDGDWEGDESAAFRAALEAIESLPKNDNVYAAMS